MDKFETNGYLFLKDVYNIELINNYNNLINQFLITNNIKAHLNKRYDVKENNLFVNNTFNSLNSFQKQQYYYLPVIDNRGCHNRITDAGMIDIYNINKLIPETSEYFDIEVMKNILKKITNKDWKLFRINLHICDNVKNTGSFHFDNFEKTIKFSIYLSDIIENSDGPLVFIEKSHNNKNNIKHSDTKIFNGKKGDLLISYQNGLHKKLGQNNSLSYYLVFNFVLK